MLGYDSGSNSNKVSGSDSGKESGTISGKNPGMCPGKKSGKELPDRVKTRVRWSGKTKNVQDEEPSLLRVRDLFVHGNIKFIQD
jgi:hypothetical protein